MGKMKYALCLAGLSLAMQACDSGSGPAGTEAGSRKYRAPSVAYIAEDSLVLIRITGSREGEETAYWIYRNDTLLDLPRYVRGAGSAHAYTLIDSLPSAGKYTYYVRYGEDPENLSGKSEDFTYEFAGSSPSGRISASAFSDPGFMADLTVIVSAERHPGGVRLERKVGAAGKVVILDSIMAPPGGVQSYRYLDTAFVADDALLHYRASLWDALEEEWLEPTAWDTLRIRNKVWDFIPAADIRSTGTEVKADPISIPSPSFKAKIYLCRNDSPSKSGRDAVDSLLTGPAGTMAPGMLDIPGEPGTYWYWLEAVDRWGRESLRSVPKAVKYTGRPMGPEIYSIGTLSTGIQLRFTANPEFTSYVLQRASDTAGTVVDADTLVVGQTDNSIGDRPPKDGIWCYRLVGVDAEGKRSDPGPWAISSPYSFVPVYSSITAAIVNKGDRIEAQAVPVSSSFSYYQILYRSRYSTGKDSLPVDTARASGSPLILEDRPSPGTWYYHLQQVPTDPVSASITYRSPLVRMDFTGKRVGPAIQSLQIYTTYIGVTIAQDPDLSAIILERSRDGLGGWTAIDTLPSGLLSRNDRPPEEGMWSYRTRGILPDLKVTDPGTPMRTSVAWTLSQTWNYSFPSTVANLGASVEATGFAPISFSGAVRLMRAAGNDYQNGIAVDSAVNVSSFTLRDTPPKGSWYYWTEQSVADAFSGAGGYRSPPVKVVFTGAPEVVTLARTGSGIQVMFPRVSAGDTVEVWRASGEPDKPESYARITSVPIISTASNAYTVDMTVDLKKAAFYHYRLVLIHLETRSEPGAYKTIYFKP